MYVSTYGGLGKGPTLHGPFAGTLGASPLHPEIREFLNEVRKRPQDYKKLLLTVTFHPEPTSQIKITIGKEPPHFLVDVALFHSFEPVIFLNKLRRIRDDFQKRDARFKQQVEAELQLRNEMIKTTGELITSQILKTKGNLAQNKTLTSFLLEAMRWTTPVELAGVGSSFALRMLPPKLAQQIRSSEVSEAHFTNLGRLLRRYAEEQQKK